MVGRAALVLIVAVVLGFLVFSSSNSPSSANGSLGQASITSVNGTTHGRHPLVPTNTPTNTPSDWPLFRHDLQNTGYSPDTTMDATQVPTKFSYAWSADTASGNGSGRFHISSTTTYRNGALLVASNREYVNASTPNQLDDAFLTSYNASTGAVNWTYANAQSAHNTVPAAYIDAAPSIVTQSGADKFLLGTWNNKVVQLPASYNTAVPTPDWTNSSIDGAVIGSVEYVVPTHDTTPLNIAVSTNGTVYALDASVGSSGSVKWSYPITRKPRLVSTPAFSVDKDTMYIEYDNNNSLTAITAFCTDNTVPGTGARLRWTYTLDSGTPVDLSYPPPVVDPSTGYIYVASGGGQVYKLVENTVNTCDQTAPTASVFYNMNGSGPAGAYASYGAMALDSTNGWLFVSGEDQHNHSIYKLNLSNDTLLGKVKISTSTSNTNYQSIRSGLALNGHDLLFVATGMSMEGQPGQLLIFDGGSNFSSSSTAIWTSWSGAGAGGPWQSGFIASPIIANDGWVYVANDDGHVYAYDMNAGGTPTPTKTPTNTPVTSTPTPVSASSSYGSDQSWPQFHHDPEHSGYASQETTMAAGNVASMTPESYTPPAPGAGTPVAKFESSPSVAIAQSSGKDVVYIGDDNNVLYAIPRVAANPTPLWTYQASTTNHGRFYAAPIAESGFNVVIAVSSDGTVYALNQTTGAFITSVSIATNGEFVSPAFVLPSSLLNNTFDFLVAAQTTYAKYTYSSLSQVITKDWSVTLDSTIWASPAVNDAYVNGNAIETSYVATADPDGSFYCFDKSGNLLWRYRISFNSWANEDAGGVSLTLDPQNKVLFGGSNKHTFYALDSGGRDGNSATAGTLKWSLPEDAGQNFTDSATYAGGAVYIGNDNGTLYKLWENNGHVAWSYTPPNDSGGTPQDGNITSSPAIMPGSGTGCSSCFYVVFAGQGTSHHMGWLYILQDGGTWNSTTCDKNTGPPCFVRNYLDGTKGDAQSFDSSPAIANGAIYIGSLNTNGGSPEVDILCAVGC